MNRQADRFKPRWLAFALGGTLLVAPAGAWGDLWTNAAGHAIEAAFLSLDGETAFFKSPDGSRFTLPLASLAPAAREQILEQEGRTVVPETLRTDYGLCLRTLKRLDVLRQAGELGDAAYTEQRATALARLEKAFKKQDVPEALRDRLRMLARNH